MANAVVKSYERPDEETGGDGVIRGRGTVDYAALDLDGSGRVSYYGVEYRRTENGDWVDENGLTDNQRRFVNNYCILGNAAHAAVLAGVHPSDAGGASAAWLRTPAVKNSIAAAEAELAARRNIAEERIVAEMASVAFFDVGEIVDKDGNLLTPDKMPERARRAVSKYKVTRNDKSDGSASISVEYSFYDKMRALPELAKIKGMYKNEDENAGGTMADAIAIANQRLKKHRESKGKTAKAEIVDYEEETP